MRKVAGTLVVVMMAAAPGAAQTNYDTVQVRTVPITSTVYLLQGAGGNIVVSAGNDAVLVVDAQVVQVTKKVQAAIAERIRSAT